MRGDLYTRESAMHPIARMVSDVPTRGSYRSRTRNWSIRRRAVSESAIRLN